MRTLKFTVEIDTLFQTDYAHSYEIADEVEKAIGHAVAKLPFYRGVKVSPVE